MREVVITGASGWIGGHVGSVLEERGWRVTGVSRNPQQARVRRPRWRWVGTGPELEEAVERAGAVVNLAGRHTFEQPWTPEYVEIMRRSRVEITARVAAAIGRSPVADRVLVTASGASVYGARGEETITEDHPVSRELVLGDIAVDWEASARAAEQAGARLVVLRLGVVLGVDGGAFPMLRAPFDTGAGVVHGSGQQWLPWIHLADAARVIADTVADPSYRGPLNAVAPQPARHADVVAAIGQALGAPAVTSLPAEQVRALFGGAGDMLLAGQRVVSGKLVGFPFHHPDLTGAVKQLVAG